MGKAETPLKAVAKPMVNRAFMCVQVIKKGGKSLPVTCGGD